MQYIQEYVSESEESETYDIQIVPTSLTKKGEVRKRRKFEESVEVRKKAKFERMREKHFPKKGCSKCKKQCFRHISKERRQELNISFWNLNYNERKSFILQHASSQIVKQRTTGIPSRRNHSLSYFLTSENGEKVPVCKTFFLTTLGYTPSNDRVVRGILTNYLRTGSIKPDGRGRAPAHNKIDVQLIQDHIESFHPVVSHYRREHAPERRYLPTDISVNLMHKMFLRDHPHFKISYEVYRREVAKKNISFVNLGHEECWSCEIFITHEKSSGHSKNNLSRECQHCSNWQKHATKYKRAREEYKTDSEKSVTCYSADLQKVIMLPRCDMFKEIVFAPRIIAFNQSFVPVGQKKTLKQFACLWHEAISGRQKEDIISTFYSFFTSPDVRDKEEITLWLDNCAAQNKNWTLFSFFIYLVNTNETQLSTLNIKYFEPGHTFMSADAFHHQVELQLKKQKKVYDFNDFVNCVERTSIKTKIQEMKIENFFQWEDYSSQYKLAKINPRPYLSDMVHVTFQRGKTNMTYRCGFDEEFIDLNFLTSKSQKVKPFKKPLQKNTPNGIDKEKKQELLKKFKNILPDNRLIFWQNLPLAQK